MANVNITVVYDPTQPSGSQWSLEGTGVNRTTIVINEKGNNPIKWSLSLASNTTGSIGFTSDPAGIVFTSTPAWPGTTPSGNSNNWNSSLTVEAGGADQTFEYTVNAMYTPAGSNPTAQLVSWDPEVEENPPATMVVKGQ